MISINNLTTEQVDEEFLKRVSRGVLELEQKGDSELSIALVGQGRIRELNKKYLGKNRVTDVLSFPWTRDSETMKEKRSQTSATMGNSIGEIVICLREVKKNAKRYKSTFQKELVKVLIHGVLHLLGEEHKSSREKKDKMRKKEEYYFALWRELR